jgi:type II secretory pathway component PulK
VYRGDRRGLVLIVVLVVLVLLALAAWTFSELMLAENQSAQYNGRRLQARALAESGVEMALWFSSLDAATQQQYGGHYDNGEYFYKRPVAGDLDGLEPGEFTISAPVVDDNGNIERFRYGLQDESAKINLNAVLVADEYQENGGRQLLVKSLGHIGMDDSLADRILDFIDEDDTPREFGAELDYYSSVGIKPKNGPLESLEELVLVDGVDWRLVFGRDLNRDGQIDGYEENLPGRFWGDNQGELAQRGWSAYLTIYSAEKNLNPDGEPKIDLNGSDMQALYDALAEKFDEKWATYIVAYRQNGAASDVTGMPKVSRTGGLDFEQTGRARLTTVLDLIGVNVAVTFKGEQDPVLLESPFAEPPRSPTDPLILKDPTALDRLLDYAAVNVDPVIGGRININEAPQVVLEALPGITDDRKQEIIPAIVNARDPENQAADSPHRHETWLLTANIVTLAEMKQLLPLICTRGAVFRADVLGYFQPEDGSPIGGSAVRLDVVIDATRVKPRLLFWRDISHLGTKTAVEAVVAAQ